MIIKETVTINGREFTRTYSDAYKIGDRVTHNGKTWVSTVNNNVWEPSAYGWEAE